MKLLFRFWPEMELRRKITGFSWSVQAGPQRDDATLTSLVLQTNEYNAANCSLEPAFNPEVTEYASKADVLCFQV